LSGNKKEEVSWIGLFSSEKKTATRGGSVKERDRLGRPFRRPAEKFQMQPCRAEVGTQADPAEKFPMQPVALELEWRATVSVVLFGVPPKSFCAAGYDQIASKS